MGRLVIKKEKGLYEKNLDQGKDGACLYDIDKDLGRTYPCHPYFDV
jgi:hypothetical protein